MFRTGSNIQYGKKYLFTFMRLSGLPGWDIEFWNDFEYKNTITAELKFAKALNTTNGATNRMTLLSRVTGLMYILMMFIKAYIMITAHR